MSALRDTASSASSMRPREHNSQKLHSSIMFLKMFFVLKSLECFHLVQCLNFKQVLEYIFPSYVMPIVQEVMSFGTNISLGVSNKTYIGRSQTMINLESQQPSSPSHWQLDLPAQGGLQTFKKIFLFGTMFVIICKPSKELLYLAYSSTVLPFLASSVQ